MPVLWVAPTAVFVVAASLVVRTLRRVSGDATAVRRSATDLDATLAQLASALAHTRSAYAVEPTSGRPGNPAP